MLLSEDNSLIKYDLFPIHNVYSHTMEDALYGYIDIKIHDFIKEKQFSKVIVIGGHDRSWSTSIYEKNDKMFNWQRPTAKLENDTLFIKCYPGHDYVLHYAELIATYLVLTKRSHVKVGYILPTENECWKPILASNLQDIPVTDIAVLGYGLPQIAAEDATWEGEGAFSWCRDGLPIENLTLIGCRHSYWADTCYRVVKALIDRGYKKIIYVGKVGGMNDDHAPNEHLATGATSFLEGETLCWDNIFDNANKFEFIKTGHHYNSPSLLFETKEWLGRNPNFDFVDSEIGYMAKACIDEGAEFGYMHIISNNLKIVNNENLSNERSATILRKRGELLSKIRSVLLDNFLPNL